MDNHVINGVIKYLYNHDHYLPAAWLYNYGNDGKPVTDLAVVASELKRLKLVDVKIDSKNGQEEYILNVPTRHKIPDILSSGTEDFYGFFLQAETEKHAVTEEKLRLELNKLRNEYQDYPKTKQRAEEAHNWGRQGLNISKISIGISIATLLITVITILLSRYKVWPFD